MIPYWHDKRVRIQGSASDPPRSVGDSRGFCVWLTGLSGAGKTTIAAALCSILEARGRTVTVLDGDVVRMTFSRGLGFSREDRHENVMRVAFLAGEIVRHGGAVICALVSPYEESRRAAKITIGEQQCLIVHVDAPIDVCAKRDPKGLYAKAQQGLIKNFTGLSDPYEPPPEPDLHLRTDHDDAERCARTVMELLRGQGFIPVTSADGPLLAR